MEITLKPDAIVQPDVMSLDCDSNELTVAIAGLALGGAEKIVLDWASRIHPRWTVHLIVLRDNNKEWPIPSFVKVTRLHGKDIIKRLTQLGKVLARSSNPVCLSHLLRTAERNALSRSGVFVVPVLHNAKAGWLEDASGLKNSPCVVSVSQACADDLKKAGWSGYSPVIRHIPGQRIFNAETRKNFRDQWKIPENATVIGMLGAIKPQKDYPFALDVLKAIHKEKDAYLVIVGGPTGRHGRNEWKTLVRKIYELKLRTRVALPGFIPDGAQCLPAFDLLLNTSHYEGLSIATLEGLINRIPVVASKVGGQGEIEDNSLILVSKESSPEVWSDVIIKALESEPATPTWTRFPSYRLWTLANLARPIKPQRKVLFITANLNSGGAQRSLVNLLKTFPGKLESELAVCGNSTASYFTKEVQNCGINVFRPANSRDAFDHAEMLVKKICDESFGTVCFWNLDPKIKLLLLKALHFTKTRFVDVSPGNNSFDEMAEIAAFQKLISYNEDEYSGRLDKLVLKYHESPPPGYWGKVTVVPNGVPENKAIKTDYAIKSVPKILVNGRITPNKFILEIIEAVKMVKSTVPGSELHFFGAAEPRQFEYAKQVMETAGDEIGKSIFFHGINFDLSRLAEFDAYVVLGKDQGCPNALLEALVVGLPVVANDNGGTKEQILPGITGFLIDSCKPEKLASALLKLLQDRTLAAYLGKNGRIHVKTAFSMEKMSQSYIKLLTEGLPKRYRLHDQILAFTDAIGIKSHGQSQFQLLTR